MPARLSVFIRKSLISALILYLATASFESVAQGFTYHWGHPSPQGNTVYGIVFKDTETGWAITGCGSIMNTTDGGQSWQLVYGPDSVCNDLYDIVRTNQGTLVISGNNGRIMRSANDGESWEINDFFEVGKLYDLALIPGGGISAAGDNRLVLVSWDDGISWDSKGIGGTGSARSHAWKSATEGYVGGQGLFHRTTDGGNTWTQIATPGSFGLNEIYFVNDLTGYAIEDFAYWKTTDGGNNWIKEDVFTSPLYRFRTVVLDDQHWFSVTFVEGGELWETTDGGVNWEEKLYHDCTGFLCLVNNGGRLLFGSDLGDIFYTDDEGESIINSTQNLAVFPSAPISVIGKRPDGTLFANNQPNSGVDNGTFYRSDDGGQSWYVPVPSPGLRWVYDIQFYNDQHGILGSYNDIRYTSDGGATWNDSNLPEGYSLANFALPAIDRYFAGTYASWPNSGGNLYKSTDLGATWQAVGGGLPANQLYVTNISFADGNTGYLACLINNLPEFYKTTDGGNNWSMIDQSGIPGFISDMAWLDESTGIAAVPNFETSGIYRTSDGGLNWERVSEESARYITEGTDNTFATTGTYSTSFQESLDGGLTWISHTPPFSSAIAGSQGYAESIQAIENVYIIGGTGNRLMRAEREDATNLAENPAPGTGSGNISQFTIIPNPVKDHAFIRFENADAGKVRIGIYDIRGILVHEVTQQYIQAGQQEISLNLSQAGQSIKPGVYFVTMMYSGNISTEKMIVIK